VEAPSPRQLELLILVEAGWLCRRPLSIRDLCRLMGIKSTNWIAETIQACRRKGLLKPADRQVARWLVPTEEGQRLVREAAEGKSRGAA
jgi:hypothetical protein